LSSARAQGPFGTALLFDGEHSIVTAPPLPDLDGSDALTISDHTDLPRLVERL